MFHLPRLAWFCAWSVVISSFLLLHHEWSRIPDGRLHIHVLDVGQGDSILVTTPGNQRILIDGGPDMALLERLGEVLPFFQRRIDLLILSHTDADHLRAFPEVMKRYDVAKVMLTGASRDTTIYEAFLATLDEEKIPVVLARGDRDLSLGAGTVLDVLWPEDSLFGQEVKLPNDAGIVFQLRTPEESILFTGDISRNVETGLLKLGLNLKSDILKIPHHGSRTSSSPSFLEAVSPELALLSVGRDNPYSHPHREVMARYRRLGIPVRSTAEEGSIELTLE